MNRRELLASFLGVPFVLSSGCGLSTAKLPIEGGFVGTSHEAGHQLRDGYRPALSDEAWKTTNVGGGGAGLCAARKLKQAYTAAFADEDEREQKFLEEERDVLDSRIDALRR